jgi:hypothetical protein
MPELAWPEQVATLSRMLDTLQGQVAGGDRTAPGLAEFKSALDDLRLRAWGLLMSVNEADPHAFQEKFRIHRGTEMCRALTTDVRTGKLGGSHPDLPALGAVARDLAGVVTQATGKNGAGKPPKGRAKRSGKR